LNLIPLTLILSPRGRGKNLFSLKRRENKSPLLTGEREKGVVMCQPDLTTLFSQKIFVAIF
jgi:hypothetical protein